MSTLGQSIALLLEHFWTWLFTMTGLTPRAGQIVHVLPLKPGMLGIKGRVAGKGQVGSSGMGNGHVNGNGHANGNGHVGKKSESRLDEGVGKFILDRCPSLRGTFTPSWWIRGGHLQTMYCVVGNFNIIDKVEYERTLIRVKDGGTIAIDITPPHHRELPDDTPTVIVAHGLTGGSHESYVRNVLEWVVRPKSQGGLGGRGVVANYRGCAGTPMTTQQAYSAMFTGDYNAVVHHTAASFPQSPLIGLGFSLGAGVLARYMGEQGERCLLKGGVSLGCPWDIPAMSTVLETGWFSSRVYSSAMGQNLARTVGRHLAPHVFLSEAERAKTPTTLDEKSDLTSPWPELAEDVIRLKNRGRKLRLKEFDDVITSKIGGLSKDEGGCFPFKDAEDYYRHASSKPFIKSVRRPLLGINAFDDPIIHGSALPVDEVAASSHVMLAVTAHGGHLGWFDGPLFGRKGRVRTRQPDGSETIERVQEFPQQRWIVKPVKEFITAMVDELDPESFGPRRQPEIERREGGWNWVKGSEVEVYGTIAWKDIQVGAQIQGGNESGVLAGL